MRIIQRGYPGHFICADKCLFRIHTDIVYDNNTTICLSSVGDYMLNGRHQSLDVFDNTHETYVFKKATMDDPAISGIIEEYHFKDNLECELKHNELVEKYSTGGYNEDTRRSE